MKRRANDRGDPLDEQRAAARANFLADERHRLGLSQEAMSEIDPEREDWIGTRTLQRFESVKGARQESQENNRKVDRIFEQVAKQKGLAPPRQKVFDLSYPENAALKELGEEPATGSAAAGGPLARSHQLLPAALAMVALGLAIAVAAVATLGESEDAGGDATTTGRTRAGVTAAPTSEVPSRPCTIAIGAQGTPLVPADASRLEEARATWREAAPVDACPREPVTYFAEGLVQALDVAGRRAGVLFLAPTGETTYLTEALWNSYRQVVDGGRPESAAAFAGYPLRIGKEHEAVVIELSTGGIIIGPNDQNQAYWIPVEALSAWRDAGGVAGTLGLPMTNPYIDPADGAYHQDYELGFGRVTEAAPLRAPIVFERLPERGHAIRAIGDVRGRVLSQRQSTTTWFVDERRRRRWIPDGEVYGCIGADRLRVGPPLPGYEIATLPLGDPMTCPGGS